MKPLFEMSFTFSLWRPLNEGFRKAFNEMCGMKYEPTKVVVVEFYTTKDVMGGVWNWVNFVLESGQVLKTGSDYIQNLPTDKEIAKNKKLFDFWRTTNEQLNKGTNESTQAI